MITSKMHPAYTTPQSNNIIFLNGIRVISMPQCPTCGNKGFRVVLYYCRVCNKAGCPNCMQTWKFLYTDLRPNEVVCSPQCLWRWIEGVFPSYRQSGLGEFSWASGLQTDIINMLDMKLAKTAEREGNYSEAIRI